ncbi:MAG: PLP-dependent transferase [Candidatus Micrarchaeia archaeon]
MESKSLHRKPIDEQLNEINVKRYETLDELKLASRDNSGKYPKSKYPRSGTEELSLLERKVGNMFDLDSSKIVVFTYGMAAVVAAIESASPTSGTIILHGKNEYSNNKKYINNTLSKRQIINVETDSYNIEKLEGIIEEKKPGIIFLESIANGPDMPVLDLNRFFEIKYIKNNKPLIIIDNTLAAGLISPKEILERDLNVIGVESGFKFYTLHRTSFGFLYSNNNDLINSIKEYRRQTGTAPDLPQTKLISSKLIGRWELLQRNSTIYKNTKIIASICNDICNENSKFVISHPNLKNNQTFDFVNKKFANGASPLFFINPKKGVDQFDIAEALLNNGVLSESCRIIESFGYDFTAIWPNSDMNFVRISPGTEKEEDAIKIGSAMKESLRKFTD